MKARKITWLTGSLLAGVVMFNQGCNNQPQWVSVAPGDQQGDVSLYRDVSFDDIPIPAEYSMIAKPSYSFQGQSSRNGVFFYQGQLEWTRALDFFRTQLPATGWNLVNTDRGFDFRVLQFRKGPEQLLVTVRQIRNGSRAELQLDNIEQNDLLLKGRLDDPMRR